MNRYIAYGKKKLIERIIGYGKRYKTYRQNADFASTAILEFDGSVHNASEEKYRISVGNHSYIRGDLFIYGHGGSISIGNWCYVGSRSQIWSMASIKIGDRALIAHDVN